MAFTNAGLYEGVLIGAGWCDLSKDGFPGVILTVEAQCHLERTDTGFIAHPCAPERGDTRCYLAYRDKRTGADVPNNISLRQIADVIPGFDPQDAEDRALVAAVGTQVRFMVEAQEYNGNQVFRVAEVRNLEWSGEKQSGTVARDAKINGAIRKACDIIATSPIQFKPANTRPSQPAPRQVAPMPGTEQQPDYKAQLNRIVELVHKWATVTSTDLMTEAGANAVANGFMGGRKLKSVPPAEYQSIESALIAAIDAATNGDDIPF